ncbi:MAG TPA: D-alanyl-D-alanine carboxypeptidase [Clostridiales bacterium]|nr:D-alanyl-D-alanine carboxypeptidase [Clostridiales bacterium]
MKTRKILILCILIILFNISKVFASVEFPQTSAQSAVLIDGSSCRVLWGKNIDEKLPMASTTKIMTALVAIESQNINRVVTIPEVAQGVEGSSIYLTAGEHLTLEELLYGLMLRSGNDAATAIAYDVGGGSIEKFVSLMNATAKRIGAYNTNFENPHGLHSDNHYTTAHDLAKITAYALKNDKFKEIVSTKYKEIPWEGSQWNRVLKNNNKLLWSFEGANGVKTGFTQKAGRCLVSSANRNDLQLVLVLLNCGPMFEESSAILEYGFNIYKSRQILSNSDAVISIPVDNGIFDSIVLYPIEDYSMALTDAEYENLKITMDIPNVIKAPIKKGKIYGNIIISINNEVIKEVPLVSKSYVADRYFGLPMKKLFELWNKKG